jgi:O-antigen ligase
MINTKSSNANTVLHPETLYRALLLILATALSLRLPDVQILLIAAGVVGYIFLRSRIERMDSYLWASLAFVAPITGILGGHFVLVLALIICAAVPGTSSLNSIKWVAPLAALLGAWAIFEIFFAGDILLFTATAFLSGDLPATAVRNWLLADVTGWMASVTLFAQLLVFVSIFSGLRSSPQNHQYALKGLLFGMAPALGITTWQIFFSETHSFSVNEQFWRSVNRYSGSFSDPNAFGVFVPLVLPFIAYAATLYNRTWIKVLLLLAGLALVFLGFYSGSRSFFLGLAGISFLTLMRWRQSVALVLLFLVAPLIVLLVSLSGGTVDEHLPSGVVRILHSLDFSNLSEAIHSRLVFLKIGVAVFLDHPLIGAGPGNFPFVAPEYAAQLGLGTGAWTDNPNNFYLGIAAELGLLGIVLFVLSVGNLRFKKSLKDSTREAYFLDSFIVLLILLFLGPHVFFMEILFLGAFAASQSIESVQVKKSAPMGRLLLSIVLIIAAGIGARYGERGLYFWEGDAYGFFRWTHGRSYSFVRCTEQKEVISLRAGNPDMAHRPIEIRVYQNGSLIGNHLLSDSTPREVVIDCSNRKGLFNRNRAYFSVELDRVWNPAKEGLGNDPRLLGVKLYARGW